MSRMDTAVVSTDLIYGCYDLLDESQLTWLFSARKLERRKKKYLAALQVSGEKNCI